MTSRGSTTLNLGELRVIDADGKVISGAPGGAGAP
jgi:hypothetical protein